MVAVGLAHPVQHQLFAGVEMQRQPVPAGLIRRQRLAAPLPVQPGLSGDLDRLVVDGDAAGHRKIRLAVIIRGLFALRFSAVAGIALQHQRPIGVEAQRVAEIGPRCGEFERRDVGRVHRIKPAHFPGIDPGAKRACLDAGLADAAAGKSFAGSVGIRRRHRGVAHPDLLIGPAFLLRAGPRRLTKQGPLRAIGGAAGVHQIRRHVPPLDPKSGCGP